MATKKTVEFSSLVVEISTFEDKSTYIFKGALDDKVREHEIPRAENKDVVFDLGQVEKISSTGIREWIKLISAFKSAKSLTFERCSVLMVDQFNMVPESMGKARIESFYAPYFHGATRKEKICLIKVDFFKPLLAKNEAPPMTDDSSGDPLEFDALEESYFSFLNHAKQGK
jgi:anti-anti-sigma regulatory factor